MSDTTIPAARSRAGGAALAGGSRRTCSGDDPRARTRRAALVACTNCSPCMRDEGFVVHYPEDRTYGLSGFVAELGTAAARSERLARLARPLLERLVADPPPSPWWRTSPCSAAPTSSTPAGCRGSVRRPPSRRRRAAARAPHRDRPRDARRAAPRAGARAVPDPRRADSPQRGRAVDAARTRRAARRRPATEAGQARTATSRPNTPRSVRRRSTATTTR